MVNKIRVREEGEPRLPGKRSQQVENKVKGDVKLAKAKVKQPKATQTEKPTEDEFVSAKELAQMAGVTPTVLRKCLRNNFAGKIPRGDDGRQYRIKANDRIVKEIMAKLKDNGGSATTPVSEDKGEGDKPSLESLLSAPESIAKQDKGVK